jgi:hypothetical protein
MDFRCPLKALVAALTAPAIAADLPTPTYAKFESVAKLGSNNFPAKMVGDLLAGR